MATNFPTSKDDGTSLAYPTALSARNSPSLAGLSDNQNDAIIAVENKLGTGASVAASSKLLVGTGAGTSEWTKDSPTGTIVGTTDSQTLTNKVLTSPTINTATIVNPTITADTISGYTAATSGTIFGIQTTLGKIASALTLNSTLTVVGATVLSSTLGTVGQPSFMTTTAPPAAGTSTAGIKLSSTANLGIYFGSGAPTFSAAQGSLYIRTDGSSTSTRMYINTNASTTWTAVTTVA